MSEAQFEKVCKGMEVHIKPNSSCVECPYRNNVLCGNQLYSDGLALIRQQQARIAELEAELGQRDYNAAIEMQQYCERYEPTYNPEDGSM